MSIREFLSSESFMPHGCCYLWKPSLIWLHVISDALIVLAYYSIPLTLVYFVRLRKNLPFHWIYLCFATFIIACGTTHLMEIWNVWHPTYWVSGIIKAITAMASVPTAILLVYLIPKALALPSPEALKKINKELELKTSQLTVANKELEAFSYSVSHDLRAPLRHIMGYINLLKEDTESLLNPSARHDLEAISHATQQMTSLIENLLAFSQVGNSGINKSLTSMNALIQETLDLLAPSFNGRQIEWKIESLPTLSVDQTLFRQVWVNLISNAVKYTKNKEKTLIQIGAREKEHVWEFYIQDNGVGFDMKYVEKLFGVFQRLHGIEEFEGTGIGLANVQRIVMRHGGKTWAEGNPNQGAVFYFTLPKEIPSTLV
ncbi:MAG: ATP-binding protein [Verrucomicrobiota bacterium]